MEMFVSENVAEPCNVHAGEERTLMVGGTRPPMASLGVVVVRGGSHSMARRRVSSQGEKWLKKPRSPYLTCLELSTVADCLATSHSTMVSKQPCTATLLHSP